MPASWSSAAVEWQLCKEVIFHTLRSPGRNTAVPQWEQVSAESATFTLYEENERLGSLYCIFFIFEKLPKQFQAELKQSYWCQGAKFFPHALLSEEGRKLFVLSSPSLFSLSQGSEERMDKWRWCFNPGTKSQPSALSSVKCGYHSFKTDRLFSGRLHTNYNASAWGNSHMQTIM